MRLPEELSELRFLKQWVAYDMQWSEKRQKYSKIPKDPRTGYGAKADDPKTWATYDEAVKCQLERSFAGVGFEFAGGYMGIDLDNVINESGELNDQAREIVETINSYTEYSPSGTGLHILVKTSLGPIGSRNDAIGLEMYNNGRFFTVTGKPYGELRPISERTAEVRQIFDKYLKKKEKPQPAPARPQLDYSEDLASNGEIWDKMFKSNRGAEIRALYDGDISRNDNDHSRADQALIDHLAYWTNGNAAKMDSMFRESGLMRDKWNERRGGNTYGERTIANALRDFTPYVGSQRKKVENVPNIPETKAPAAGSETPAPNTRPDSIKNYIYGKMKEDLTEFQQYIDRKTGYSNIDEFTSLYPGLYVLGAISSLGKTTFIHQMGDQIAEQGDHVIFFSLEQSKLEMVTKGISRETAKLSFDKCYAGAVSSINIRRGNKSEIVKEATKNYLKVANRSNVVECGFETTINFIIDYVERYIKENNVKPVVIVDYLQIIRPEDARQTTKDAVDNNVRKLKTLQRDKDLVMIVVCSLNRSNYLTPVDFESFKESGGIEYTADVVWGLQLQVIRSPLFDKKDQLKEKRETIRQHKLSNPRKVELVCLKNRYGVSSYSVGFNYLSAYDYFIPTTDFNVVEYKGENPYTPMGTPETLIDTENESAGEVKTRRSAKKTTTRKK